MIYLERAFLFILIFAALGSSSSNALDPSAPLPEGKAVSSDSPSASEPPAENSIQRTNWQARIIRSKKSEELMENLGLPEIQLPVVMVHSGTKFRPMVEIPVSFKARGWTLFIQDKIQVTPTGEPGKFKIFAYMNGPLNEMLLVAHGPSGKKRSEIVYIYTPEAQEFNVVTPWDAVKLTIGSSYLGYQQTGYNDFYSWSGLLSVQIHSPEKASAFGYIADANVTAITLTSNQSDYGPQIIQSSLNGIYFFPWSLSTPWRIQALAGIEYSTMITNGSPFGFKDLISTELGLRSRYILNTKSDIASELRLMPLNSSMDLNQLGTMFSISKSWILSNLHRGEVGLRYYTLHYKPDPTQTVSLKTISFVISYSL